MFPLTCLTPQQCYVLILPSDETDQMIVFLHGLGDSAQNFARASIVQTVRQQMARGEIPPTILMIPEGERGYWLDWVDGEHLYETWTLESISTVVDQYDVEHTSLVGVSMGGLGALSMGLRHPELVESMVAYSPTDLEIALEDYPTYSLYHNVFGTDFYTEYAYALNPRELILRGAGHNQNIAWVVGDSEQRKFTEGSERLVRAAESQGLAPSVRVVEGGEHSFEKTWSLESTQWWIDHWKSWSEE